MSTPSLAFRTAAAFATLLLVVPPAAAQDTYYWNAASGTAWTAPNAWQLNSTTGPAATWVNGSRAVFDNSVAGIAALSSNVTATGVEFAGTAGLTIAPMTGSAWSLTLGGGGTTGTIALSTGSQLSINAPLGGADITVLRTATAPASTGTTVKFGDANTFTGNLIIGGGGQFTNETNVVRLSGAGALPTTATVRFAGRNAAVVFDRGTPANLTLPNNIELNTGGATAGQSNLFRAADVTRVEFTGTISGTGGLILGVDPNGGTSGTGSVFAFTRANTYSGNTTVGPGITLLVNNPLSGTDSATGTGGVTANAGRVGGTGRIGGVDAALGEGLRFGGAGRLAPGDPAVNGGIGRLIVDRNVAWIAGGTYEVQLGGLTDADANRDQFLTTGILRIDAANARVKVDVGKVGNFDFVPGQTYSYRIAQAADGITMLGGAGGQFDPSRFEITSSFGNAAEFTLSYENGVGTANYLVLNYTPVPEPAFILLACAAAAGGCGAARRVRSRRDNSLEVRP